MAWRWPGPRGEAYVAIQFVLITLIVLSPFYPLGSSAAWLGDPGPWARWSGAALLLASFLLAFTAARSLGRSLTALPKPKDGAVLVTTGLYGKVRHPIYTGILGMGLGWSLGWRDKRALLLVILLAVILDRKLRREERWLAEKYPGYASYMGRTKRLLPWLY